jgi:hypothetical protein
MGVIETHADQRSNFKNSGPITANRQDNAIMRASGAASMTEHRIIGRGTRFETQFGKKDHWSKKVTPNPKLLILNPKPGTRNPKP